MSRQAVRSLDTGRRIARPASPIDEAMLLSALALLGIGLVMVASSSLDIAARQGGGASYYVVRQACYILVGIALGGLLMRLPVAFWERHSVAPLLLVCGLLVAVLIPGIGREVNGSMRWISLGLFQLQPSELAKCAVAIYLAGYLVRHADEIDQGVGAFVRPLLIILFVAGLLILEPDFGSVVVLMAMAMIMLFLGRVRFGQFAAMLLSLSALMTGLILSSPYRLQRITAFMDPWADPFASGFQLTQALIAFGRGDWFGVGLGDSIQKLAYLPEAHTDFVFAVLAEELGLIGVIGVLALFLVIVVRAFVIGRHCERQGRAFAAWLSYGLGSWLALQSLVNMAVNMGLLPTKGLTLPLMSYGGSSLVTGCLVIALLLRIDYERRLHDREAAA